MSFCEKGISGNVERNIEKNCLMIDSGIFHNCFDEVTGACSLNYNF